jgi:hypothetical protein
MDEQAEHHDIVWKDLVGGVVLGFVACWSFFVVAVFVTYLTVGDSTATWVSALMWASLAVVPLAFLVTALVRRKRGQVVAGMLLGLTIGSIVGAGVCTTYSLLVVA